MKEDQPRYPAPEHPRSIDRYNAAQPDGYLFTYYTLNTPDRRWTDMSFHEAYCLGHMVEGAIAYHQATGKDKWLRAAERAVRQMMSVIGPGRKHWVTGHQELELALVRLYRHTGEKDYLDYSMWLVDERGHGHLDAPFFEDKSFFVPEYCQDDVPARELSAVTGHAVRAMYYYSAMADLAVLTGDAGLRTALDRLWANVVPANLYLTGGIGQSAHNEGFTSDWSLPNLTAYCETCAAIGMAMWNHRMHLLSGQAKYADLVETEMYNGALAGVSLSGDRFFYVNPLSSAGNHHRRPWYDVSCCPTNLIRFLPSVGGYAYTTAPGTVYINQYIPGTAEIPLDGGAVQLNVDTRYPWDGAISIRVIECASKILLRLRIPGWCRAFTLAVNDMARKAEITDGYVQIAAMPSDSICLTLDMPVRREYADSRVLENAGRVSLARGPIIYCAEECDNPGIPSEYFHADLELSKSAQAQIQARQDLLGGIVSIQCGDVQLIPYCLWDNRTPGGMAVWLKERI